MHTYVTGWKRYGEKILTRLSPDLLWSPLPLLLLLTCSDCHPIGPRYVKKACMLWEVIDFRLKYARPNPFCRSSFKISICVMLVRCFMRLSLVIFIWEKSRNKSGESLRCGEVRVTTSFTFQQMRCCCTVSRIVLTNKKKLAKIHAQICLVFAFSALLFAYKRADFILLVGSLFKKALK